MKKKAVSLRAELSLGFALLLWATLAVAQNNLGELLDAGAKKLSPDEFKQELVQRVLVGPMSNGGHIEVMYASSGVIAGIGGIGFMGTDTRNIAPVSGEWKIDENGKVCASVQMGLPGGGPMALPYRCQSWFKLGEQYYLSDSDSDRHARVLLRTLKQ